MFVFFSLKLHSFISKPCECAPGVSSLSLYFHRCRRPGSSCEVRERTDLGCVTVYVCVSVCLSLSLSLSPYIIIGCNLSSTSNVAREICHQFVDA